MSYTAFIPFIHYLTLYFLPAIDACSTRFQTREGPEDDDASANAQVRLPADAWSRNCRTPRPSAQIVPATMRQTSRSLSALGNRIPAILASRFLDQSPWARQKRVDRLASTSCGGSEAASAAANRAAGHLSAFSLSHPWGAVHCPAGGFFTFIGRSCAAVGVQNLPCIPMTYEFSDFPQLSQRVCRHDPRSCRKTELRRFAQIIAAAAVAPASACRSCQFAFPHFPQDVEKDVTKRGPKLVTLTQDLLPFVSTSRGAAP